MSKKRIETIADLMPDPMNANEGTQRGHQIIEHSLRNRGAGRSGLAANDGTMIAGNQTLTKIAELGFKIKPVHTKGDEWVVVIRDDIEPGSEEAKLLALDDNRASEVGLRWNANILAETAKQLNTTHLFFPSELPSTTVSMLAQVANDMPQPSYLDEIKDDDARGRGALESEMSYMNNAIKQIVLYFGMEEYLQVIDALERIRTQNDLTDNTSVFNFLLNHYEATT